MIQQINLNTNFNSQQENVNLELYWKEIKKDYKKYHETSCYGDGLIGNITKFIVTISINIVFVISALCLLICNNNSYKNYRDLIKSNPLSNYEKFWCDFGKYEKGILISYFILLILVLSFKIVSLLIHKKRIKIGNGFFYKIIILLNFLFSVIFIIYLSLIIYLFSLSILIISKHPLKFRKYPTIFNETILNNTNATNINITRRKISIRRKLGKSNNYFYNIYYNYIYYIYFAYFFRVNR